MARDAGAQRVGDAATLTPVRCSLYTVAVSASPPDDAAGRRDRSRRAARTRVLALTDRVPTGWFAGILTVLFLTVTAAFGGLSAVAVAPVPGR